jgi:hypothetical protein
VLREHRHNVNHFIAIWSGSGGNCDAVRSRNKVERIPGMGLFARWTVVNS